MSESISVAEYRKLLKRGQHKYHARACVVDGLRFDSQAEAARYAELQLLVSGGQIRDLVIQPRYQLQPAFRDRDGRKVAAIVYVGDFSYLEVSSGLQVCEDVKGVETALFKLKAKLLRFLYPQIELRVLHLGARAA